ncbi:MAG: aromatic amino acid transport family protein [Clostridiales bacterium]|nr:aromatic amino acid transport family protein [Clostridiales bacterium]
MEKIRSESNLSFLEATSIIVGHGVGAGILSVPYLAAHNSLREILLVTGFCYLFNVLLHLLIAELSLNNGGAQFVGCFESELFAGRLRTVLTWGTFILLGASVLVNVSAFLTGAAAVFRSWFGLPDWMGMLIFYVLGAGVVFAGMKLVGICEKFSVGAMVAVVGILFAATVLRDTSPMPSGWKGFNNMLAMFGMVSFSLSAVMSTPQVVKGLGGDAKKIRASIMTGLAVNAGLILFITVTTLLGVGGNISEDGALVDLAASLGGFVSVIGYVFTLLALATSFWANTLNLRDIVSEQTGWSRRLSWLAASLPCLILAFLGLSSFVGFTRFASIIQVVTGLGIIVAYSLSRKRVGGSALLGRFGSLPFQIIIACCSLLATVGAVLPVT